MEPATASVSEVAALVRQLRSGSKLAQVRAATEVGTKSVNASFLQAFVSAGGCAALVRCLSSGSMAVRQAAANALVDVTANHDASPDAAVEAAGGIPALCRLLCSSSEKADVRARAAAALRNLLFYDQSNVQEAVAAGVIPAAVGLLGSSSPEVHRAAVGLLICVARSPGMDAGIAAVEGAVPALVGVLSSSDQHAEKYAALLLGE